jgi:threonine dehydrogenase-like Zn-dependent dehydrogenase
VAGEVDVSALITHRVPLARVAEGVDLMRRREALKVFVTP